MTDQTTGAVAPAEAQPIVDKIDQIINDAIAKDEQAKEEPKVEQDAADGIDPDKEPTEKAYLNALAKNKGKLAKERFLRMEMEKRIAELEVRKAPESKQSDGAPNPKDFEGKPWAEYVDALVEYKAALKAEQQRRTTQEQQNVTERREWQQERVEHAADNEVVAAKALPDFNQVVNENIAFVSRLPQSIKDVILESENPSFALYQLIKDGQLASLAEVSPTMAARMIDRAEAKALAQKKAAPTKAPAPLASAKGTASGSKSLTEYSSDDLRKMLREP